MFIIPARPKFLCCACIFFGYSQGVHTNSLGSLVPSRTLLALCAELVLATLVPSMDRSQYILGAIRSGDECNHRYKKGS